MKNKTIKTVWELWEYEVWGNRLDGYDVNNRFCMNRQYVINLKVQKANEFLPSEFTFATPSDYQLKKAFGVSCAIDTTGDDMIIYVERESDGYPIGELCCMSHESLSPIRSNDN